MITIKQVREQINADPTNWCVYLLDFVDDFRYRRDASSVTESFPLSHDEKDALLASTAEALCDELGIEIPGWLANVPACTDPYFVSGLENLKAFAIVESPLRFRIRKVFVLENFLNRV